MNSISLCIVGIPTSLGCLCSPYLLLFLSCCENVIWLSLFFLYRENKGYLEHKGNLVHKVHADFRNEKKATQFNGLHGFFLLLLMLLKFY